MPFERRRRAGEGRVNIHVAVVLEVGRGIRQQRVGGISLGVAETLKMFRHVSEVRRNGVMLRRDGDGGGDDGVGRQRVADQARLRASRHRYVDEMSARHDEDPRLPLYGV